MFSFTGSELFFCSSSNSSPDTPYKHQDRGEKFLSLKVLRTIWFIIITMVFSNFDENRGQVRRLLVGFDLIGRYKPKSGLKVFRPYQPFQFIPHFMLPQISGCSLSSGTVCRIRFHRNTFSIK